MDFYALSILLGLSILSIITTVTSLSPALILTPYLEQNSTGDARKLSTVDPSLFLNVTSHSGFLTVDKRYNSNAFFWYFPVEGKAVNETPWIIWLQAGTGLSSLSGFFNEIGPFQYDAGTSRLKLQEWSWWRNYSMVFIDNPIGSGFSFTDKEAGYAHNITQYTACLYTAVQQMVSIFPELGSAPLYIAGESLAGKYGPALAAEIIRNQTGNATVNLQGVILGNPIISPTDQSNYTELFYQWGLVDTQGALAVKDLQDAYTRAIDEGDAAKAFELRNKLVNKLLMISAQSQTYNLINDNYEHLEDFASYLRKEEVKEALHVGDTKFEYNSENVIQKLVPDFLDSATEKIEAVLEHCKVLIYCGQLDVLAGCGSGAAARRYWQWSRHGEFLSAPRMPWADENDSLTGYVKSGGGLTEVLIRGAGHLAVRDKPKEMSQLISYFIRGIDLPTIPNYQVLPEYTPPIRKPSIPNNNTSKGIPKDKTNERDKTNEKDKTNEGTSLLISSGAVVSILVNVILVVIIVVGIILYVRMKRKYDSFYYSTVDNLSDDIFLS